MNVLDGGWQSYALLFVVGFGMTAPWRVLGVLLASNIDVQSEIFKWVKAVSTALVAGLIARMVIFPSGNLATIASPLRFGAFIAGVVAYYLLRRNLGMGILVSLLVLMAGQWMLG